MKNNPLINSLVIASSVIALAGATLYAVTVQQDSTSVQANTTQVSPDKVPLSTHW